MTPHILSQSAITTAAATETTGNRAQQLQAKMAAANTAMNDIEATLQQTRDAENAKHVSKPWMDRPNTSHITAKGPKGLSAHLAVLTALDWPYLLIKDTTMDHPIWGDTAILHNLLLEDGSFFLFENHLITHAEGTGATTFALLDPPCSPQEDIKNGLGVLLHSTLTLTETEDSLIVMLRDAYMEEDDPTIDEHESCQEWSHEDAQKARELAMSAFVFLAENDKALAEISMEGSEGDGIEVHHCEHVDQEKLKVLLNHVLNPDDYEGYQYEYNDGAIGRLSGYSKDCTVFWEDFSLDALSAHQILDMKTAGKTLFEKVL